jgi:hypothetical protein
MWLGPALWATALFTTPALASDATESCLQTKMWETEEQGYSVRAVSTKDLEVSQFQTIKTALFSNREYVVRSCADTGVSLLELVVYDSRGEEIARSTDHGRSPNLTIKPQTAASVYIVVQVRGASPGPHSVSIGVLYK